MAKAPLTLLLDFDDQVRRDRAQPATFLHRRDRRFALACEADKQNPDAEHWLDYLARLSHSRGREVPDRDPRLKPWRRIALVFAGLGAMLGMLAMLGLLYYDGSQQINVTVILAFIFLQLLLAIFTTAQSFLGWRPWSGLVKTLQRRLGQGPADESGSTILEQLQPQLAARAAHLGGLVFGLFGLVTLLFLIVVQDLAFGWSTTLDTAPGSFHSLVAAVAAPWQQLWPAAVPSPELVSESRFYRLEESAATLAPTRWGDWWPFVAMSWLVYIVFPRVLLLLLTVSHLRLRVRRLLASHPGRIALQYRMETPALETGTGPADSADQPDLSTGLAVAEVPSSRVLVRWAGATVPDEADLLDGKNSLTVNAGGANSLQEDQRALEEVRGYLDGDRRNVLLATRSWEPPTGELSDFLEEARECWPNDSLIAIVPLHNSLAEPPPDHQLGQWLRFAERRPDLRLRICHPFRSLNASGIDGARFAVSGGPEIYS